MTSTWECGVGGEDFDELLGTLLYDFDFGESSRKLKLLKTTRYVPREVGSAKRMRLRIFGYQSKFLDFG